MKAALAIPLLVLLCGGIGYVLLRMTDRDAHIREMLVAGAACILSAEIGLVPAVLTRKAGQVAAMQGALAAITAHTLLAIAIGAGLAWLFRVPGKLPFVVWLVAFYWITLTALSAAAAVIVRSADPPPPARAA